MDSNLNNSRDPTTENQPRPYPGAPRRRNQGANSAVQRDVLPEADQSVISEMRPLFSVSDMASLAQFWLQRSQVAIMIFTFLDILYVCLIPSSMRCRSLLFIIRCLQTLRRLISRAPVGPEPNMMTCLDAQAIDFLVLANLFFLNLTWSMMRSVVSTEQMRLRLDAIRRRFEGLE